MEQKNIQVEVQGKNVLPTSIKNLRELTTEITQTSADATVAKGLAEVNTEIVADKDYDTAKFSGMGRVNLQKNIVDGHNYLTQEMVSKANTIYKIQYDYEIAPVTTGYIAELNQGTIEVEGHTFNYKVIAANAGDIITKESGIGNTTAILYMTSDNVWHNPHTPVLPVEEGWTIAIADVVGGSTAVNYNVTTKNITIPENCVLEFEGGSISGGTLIGNGTGIEAGIVEIFDANVAIDGTWTVEGTYPEWFGSDYYSAREKLLKLYKHSVSREIISGGGSVGGKPLYGTFNNAVALNVDWEGRNAGILGIKSKEEMAAYSGRDMCGLSVAMRSPEEVRVTGSNFTANSVVLSNIPEFLCRGMILDVLDENNTQSTKYSGIISSIDATTNTVYVEYWVKVGNSASGQIPTYTQTNNVAVNPCTKIWGLFIATLINDAKSAYNSVIAEYNIWNARTKTPNTSGGHDVVLKLGKCEFGYRSRSDSTEDGSHIDAGFVDMLDSLGFLCDRSYNGFKAEGFKGKGLELIGDTNSTAISISDILSNYERFRINGRGFVERIAYMPCYIETENQQIEANDGQHIIVPSNISSFTLPAVANINVVYTVFVTGRSRVITINSANVEGSTRIPVWYLDEYGEEIQAYSMSVDIVNEPVFIIYQANKWMVYFPKKNKAGTTQERPNGDALKSGLQFFDKTLGKPIWWNGTAWAETDGATAGVQRTGLITKRPATSDIPAGFTYVVTASFDIGGTTYNAGVYAYIGSDNWITPDGTTVSDGTLPTRS